MRKKSMKKAVSSFALAAAVVLCAVGTAMASYVLAAETGPVNAVRTCQHNDQTYLLFQLADGVDRWYAAGADELIRQVVMASLLSGKEMRVRYAYTPHTLCTLPFQSYLVYYGPGNDGDVGVEILP